MTAPRLEADLALVGDRVVGTIRNASDRLLRQPAVVLGTGVVVLGDLAPGATARIDLRAEPESFGRALSERIFGAQQFTPDGRPTRDYLRDIVRRQLVDALTYDPWFGSYGTLPSDAPVLLAWGEPGLLPVEVAGAEPRTAGETLYYLPLALGASGAVTFTPDLMRSSLVEAKAQVFSKDPFNLAIGGGSVTLAYRPIPVSGTLVATRLAIGVNMGQAGSLKPGAAGGVEPALPADPAAPDVPPELKTELPRLELFDRDAAGWREVRDLVSGVVVEIRQPGRFVDPASGTVLVRLTNEGQEAVGLQLALQLEGEIR